MDKETIQWVRTLVLAIVIAIVISMLARPVVVKGASMEPTYKEGNWLILNKFAYWFNQPQIGETLVFTGDNEFGESKDCVKRVIALPGDSIKIFEGKVYRNNELVIEDYVLDDYTEGDLVIDKIPEGQYFVLGDNRGVSLDSRTEYIGLVSEAKVKGKIVFTLIGQ